MGIEVQDVVHYNKIFLAFILQNKTGLDNETIRKHVLSIQPDHFSELSEVIYEYLYTSYLNNINFIPFHNLKAIEDFVRGTKATQDVRGTFTSYLNPELLVGYQYEQVYFQILITFNKHQTGLLKFRYLPLFEKAETLEEINEFIQGINNSMQKIVVPTHNTFDVETATKHLFLPYIERGIETFCDEWNWRLSGDERIGMEWDSFHLITGATGSGKSCLAQDLQSKFEESNVPVAYFNIENPEHLFLKRYICNKSNILTTYDCNMYILNNSDRKKEEFNKWKHHLQHQLDSKKLYLYDNTYYQFERIIEIIKNLANKGVRVFIIDTMNRLRIMSKQDSEKYLYIGDIASKFEQIAHDFKCIIIGLAQENEFTGGTKGAKDTNEVATTITRIQRLSAEEADRNINDEIVPTTLLKVTKARDGEEGTTKIYFDREHFKYIQPIAIRNKFFASRMQRIEQLKLSKIDNEESAEELDLPF